MYRDTQFAATANRTARVLLAVVLLVFAPSVLAACSRHTTLDGTSWRLVGWSVSSLSPSEFMITATFDDGRISGMSAVNNYGGEYTTGPRGSFSVGEIGQTLMAGPEPAMRAESIYHELLSAARSYRLNATTLTLFDANGNESLIFEAAAK